MTQHTFFATCAPGLEPLLHEEVRALRFGRAERQVGGVLFMGDMRDAWRANLELRTAIRVLLRLERFEARDDDELYKKVGRHDWRPWLKPDGILWVQAQTRESQLDHTRFIAQRVKDAIVDQLRLADGTRPSVDRERSDLRVHLHLWRERATLSIDTSGESLHKRGWRVAQGRAPLPETLAAGIVLASGWDRRAPLLDPFCGSGTLLVEAAWLATNTAPGSMRERFAFERWPSHAPEPWRKLRASLAAARKPAPKLRLIGFDIDRQRVDETRENAAAAGVEDMLEVERADAREFEPRPGWNACIVSNLPFGERVRGGDIVGLHRDFGRILRERCAGYRCALLAGDDVLADALGLPGARRTNVMLGGTERVLVTAEL